MTTKYLKPDGTWHFTRAEVEHINTLNEQIARLTVERDSAQQAMLHLNNQCDVLFRERDEARTELARLQEIHCRGCDCSMDDACAFARERDAAKAERDRALALLRRWRTQVREGATVHQWAAMVAEIDALLKEEGR